MNTIDIHLFQVTPSDKLLDSSAAGAVAALLDMELVEDGQRRELIASARTVRELLSCFLTGSKDENRLMTHAMNAVLGAAGLAETIGWSTEQRGIRVSETFEAAKGERRSFLTARYAQLRADRVLAGRVYFNVMVANRAFFSEDLPIAEMLDILRNIGGQHYLPAFDRVNRNRCVITGFKNTPLFHFLPNSKQRLGDLLLKRGRMTPGEFERRMLEAEHGNKSAAEILIAWCRHGRSDKPYAYPAMDLMLSASTALQGFVADHRRKLPESLQEAGDLCAAGFKIIRNCMDDKKEVFADLERVLGEWFEQSPPRAATWFELDYEKNRDVRRKEKFGLKAVAPTKAELVELNSKNIILYPTEGPEEAERVFHGFFVGPTCQARRLGFDFKTMSYSERVAVEKPGTIVDRIVNTVGPQANVVMAWRRKSNGSLTNNRIIEFELMRNGMAVQHIVDEGQRGNANKIGHVLQGMVEKFALRPNGKCCVDSPFDLALGLDVSRHAGLNVPAMPVIVDRDGHAAIHMPEGLDETAKERRTSVEIIDMLKGVSGGRPLSILFLRDGYAYENFEEVARAVPDIRLTVVSIRKNLLGTFSDAMPKGELYALYADHDEQRFLFGLNARQGAETRINSLHMAEIIRNPEGHGKDVLARVLIELAQQNRTSEFEVSSLPFPIAYADRTAWTIRDMIQDRQLRKHVRENYAEQVNIFGDEARYIYSVIREYVIARPNGYAFAI